jgi:hypothetical protein
VVHSTAVARLARIRYTRMSSKTYAPVSSSSETYASPEKQNRDYTPHQLRRQNSKHFPDKTTIPLILLAFICLVGCITIVYCANGKVVGGWVQPTVLLAFFSAIFSFCIKLVFSSGVGIVWWRALEKDNASGSASYLETQNRGKHRTCRQSFELLKSEAGTCGICSHHYRTFLRRPSSSTLYQNWII